MEKSQTYFQAVILKSPAQSDGELKNQDRAEWFSPVHTACVCDGVTSSPHAARAAEIASTFSPALFDRDIKQQLETLSNILLCQRLSAQDKGINITNTSANMQKIMQEAAREKLKHSFQTTLVAAKLFPHDHSITVRLIWIGDSGFFAYSTAGDLLLTNLAMETKLLKNIINPQQKIWFGPGAAIITKIVGELADYPALIRKTSFRNAIICQVLSSSAETPIKKITSSGLWLNPGETLIVPSYLLSHPCDVRYRHLATVIYSRFIQSTACPMQDKIKVVLKDAANTTEVIPDHFETSNSHYLQEEFPEDAEFLLCSDGFYRCFNQPSEMLTFLKRYRSSSKKAQFIKHLHHRLIDSFGDDDISVIWISPNKKRKPDHAE